MTRIRLPQPLSIEVALKIYYTKIELSNKDIVDLFGNLSSATISRMKKQVREQMIEDGVQSWNAQYINTKVAYQTWGLNISDLEERYNKLKKLGIA